MADDDTELQDSMTALAESRAEATTEDDEDGQPETPVTKASPALSPRVLVPKVKAAPPSTDGGWVTVKDSRPPATNKPLDRTGTPIDFLRPDQIVSLKARNDVEINRQRVHSMAALRGVMDDAIAEATHTGTVSKPANEDYFVHVLGPETGRQVYQSYSEGIQGAMDGYRLAAMSPSEQRDLISKYEPIEGSDGYAFQLRRYQSFQNQAARLDAERAKDPATFALQHAPTVAQAYRNYNKAVQSGDLEHSKIAARLLANEMDAAQAHYGIDEAHRKLFPKPLINAMQEKLMSANQEGGEGAYKFILGQAAIWGDNWPRIYSQAKKGLGPLFEVIGSLTDNLTPIAGQTLARAANVPTSKILATLEKEQTDGLLREVTTLMQQFNRTAWGSDREDTIIAFDDQAKKLAALYMSEGKASSPTKAAKMAFDDLVGKHYTFVGQMRIPVTVPYDPSVIGYGAEVAKRMLGTEIPVKSKIDRLGRGVSEQHLADATVQNLKDFGVWVTAPGDTGLALRQENGPFARGADGKPIVFTWKQLSDLASGRKAIDHPAAQDFRWIQ